MVTYNIDLNNKVILVTGAAGFIGANLVKRLLDEFASVKVIGIDCITDYYDVRLKYERLESLAIYGDRFVFIKENIANKEAVDNIFAKYNGLSFASLSILTLLFYKNLIKTGGYKINFFRSVVFSNRQSDCTSG